MLRSDRWEFSDVDAATSWRSELLGETIEWKSSPIDVDGMSWFNENDFQLLLGPDWARFLNWHRDRSAMLDTIDIPTGINANAFDSYWKTLKLYSMIAEDFGGLCLFVTDQSSSGINDCRELEKISGDDYGSRQKMIAEHLFWVACNPEVGIYGFSPRLGEGRMAAKAFKDLGKRKVFVNFNFVDDPPVGVPLLTCFARRSRQSPAENRILQMPKEGLPVSSRMNSSYEPRVAMAWLGYLRSIFMEWNNLHSEPGPNESITDFFPGPTTIFQKQNQVDIFESHSVFGGVELQSGLPGNNDSRPIGPDWSNWSLVNPKKSNFMLRLTRYVKFRPGFSVRAAGVGLPTTSYLSIKVRQGRNECVGYAWEESIDWTTATQTWYLRDGKAKSLFLLVEADSSKTSWFFQTMSFSIGNRKPEWILRTSLCYYDSPKSAKGVPLVALTFETDWASLLMPVGVALLLMMVVPSASNLFTVAHESSSRNCRKAIATENFNYSEDLLLALLREHLDLDILTSDDDSSDSSSNDDDVS